MVKDSSGHARHASALGTGVQYSARGSADFSPPTSPGRESLRMKLRQMGKKTVREEVVERQRTRVKVHNRQVQQQQQQQQQQHDDCGSDADDEEGDEEERP